MNKWMLGNRIGCKCIPQTFLPAVSTLWSADAAARASKMKYCHFPVICQVLCILLLRLTTSLLGGVWSISTFSHLFATLYPLSMTDHLVASKCILPVICQVLYPPSTTTTDHLVAGGRHLIYFYFSPCTRKVSSGTNIAIRPRFEVSVADGETHEACAGHALILLLPTFISKPLHLLKFHMPWYCCCQHLFQNLYIYWTSTCLDASLAKNVSCIHALEDLWMLGFC